jgi:hypothetical protein
MNAAGMAGLAVLTAVAMQSSPRIPDASQLPRDCSVPSGVAPMSPMQGARTKGYVNHAPLEGNDFGFDLTRLGQKSGLVVIATVKSAECLLSQTPYSFVYTHYAIEASEILKGNAPAVYPFTVRARGGRVVSGDGRWMETVVDSVIPLRVGSSYVLFLDPARQVALLNGPAVPPSPIYQLSTPRYAAFELGADGIVKPMTTSNAQVAAVHRGRTNAAFLDDVRAATRLATRRPD